MRLCMETNQSRLITWSTNSVSYGASAKIKNKLVTFCIYNSLSVNHKNINVKKFLSQIVSNIRIYLF